MHKGFICTKRRDHAYFISIFVYSLFTGGCYFTQQPWHLGAMRFFAALGMGGEWSLDVALVMECWPDRLRPLLAGVIIHRRLLKKTSRFWSLH